ncbi:hypothetical protein BGW36DRAFT_387076 [Talaromyces proteolyticus]|uniref:Uncharacterized protein n=1 Tax=Talaromyces proteolyticus TaxID=1131652 RepID=A0AAD4KIY9_9EURO|nr:uncharacterized protein BGW36DRAFT_387076 [Talaromyces proteolyticus]KAH8692139.1 hypothetical protein BGW36DRAFT_387076 [Talaromyces proteolyticus]
MLFASHQSHTSLSLGTIHCHGTNIISNTLRPAPRNSFLVRKLQVRSNRIIPRPSWRYWPRR